MSNSRTMIERMTQEEIEAIYGSDAYLEVLEKNQRTHDSARHVRNQERQEQWEKKDAKKKRWRKFF